MPSPGEAPERPSSGTGGWAVQSEEASTAPSLERVLQEIGDLRDLFRRRLLDDRARAQAVDELRAQLEFSRAGLVREFLAPLYRELLLVIDRMERIREDPVAVSVAVELEEVLARHGVVRAAVRDEFDPAQQVAARTESSDSVSAGFLIDILRPGYWLGEVLLRPTSVVVSSGLDTTGQQKDVVDHLGSDPVGSAASDGGG